MLNDQHRAENVVAFPKKRLERERLAIQAVVPDGVRPMSSDELSQLGSFEKALIGITFTIRNLETGDVSLPDAERQVAKILATLQGRFC